MVGLMAARAAQRPRAVSATAQVSVDDPRTQRALDALLATVQRLEALRSRDVVTADLVVGTNKVRHGLGRAVAGYTITPTVANAAFAHRIDTTNPRPELEAWIVIIGAAQPGVTLEIF